MAKPDEDDVVIEESDEVGPRPFWSGTITFGLVSIPVALYPANRALATSLRMVSKDGVPLQRRYYCSKDDRALDWDDIVRGYEVENDTYVVVTDDELERLAPEKTRDIDLRRFVPASEIDPIHFERAYFLTPAGNSTKAYRLLAATMEQMDRAGIATFVMRAKEYLVAIFAENGILRAETLRFADEVRAPADVGLPDPVKPTAAAVKRFEKAVRALAEKALDEDELVDTGAARLQELVARKEESGTDVVEAPAPMEVTGGGIIDLMEVLKRSLEGGGQAAKPAKRAAGDDLGDASKDELYDRAKALDIPGRSAMSKAELIRAIRKSA
ncbi:MAG TPA: Ku protein [Longimicrobiales bacterium]|nr:Ku protein [Longimicrobiales bacterium]